MSLVEIACPRCHEPTRWEGNPHRPFCSERCRLLDLGAWAEERYRIPGNASLLPADEGENDHD